MSRSFLLHRRILQSATMFMVLAVTAQGQDGLTLSKGDQRFTVVNGRAVLVYDVTGELVASGKLEAVAGDRLVVKGRYRHQVPVEYIGKLVVNRRRTLAEEFDYRLTRTVVLELAWIGIFGTAISFEGEALLFMAAGCTVIPVVEAAGLLLKAVGTIFARTYSIGGPDGWALEVPPDGH